MRKLLNVNAYGRVQGVLYRAAARAKAHELGLSGFAENRDDGSVHIEVLGEEEDLKQFLEWSKRGPLFAKVERVESGFTDTHKQFESFEIR